MTTLPWVSACRACACLLLLGSAGAAWAQQPPPPEPASPITDHFALRASYLFGTAGTDGRVDDPAAPTPGTPFSLENDFHMTPHARQLRPEFMFRLRERGRLRVDMWELNRTGIASPQAGIVYGGNTFTSADVVESRLDWRQVDFTYTYSFLRRHRYELGAGLGLHLLQTEAEARVAPSSTRPVAVREDFSGSGPFVTIAVDGTWLIAPRWALSARAQYLSLTVSSVKGSLSDYHADLQYRWRPNLAAGIGYSTTRTSLEVRNNNPNGVMRLAVRGPELFLRASF
jgi:hypothetical protein